MRGTSRERITIGRYPNMALTDAGKEAKRLVTAEVVTKPASLRFGQAKLPLLAGNFRDTSRRTLDEAKPCLRPDTVSALSRLLYFRIDGPNQIDDCLF